MAEEYVVTAAYITPKVRDDAKGGWAHRGFYEGAVIRAENIHPDSLQHHLAGDMLAERDAPAADPEPVAEAPADLPRPKAADPKGVWVAFAVAQRPEGQSEADAQVEAEGMSKADLVATFGS
jgi:hypothetical protein